jgi:hypothetical protein
MHDAATSSVVLAIASAASAAAAIALWILLHRKLHPRSRRASRVAAVLRLGVGAAAWRLGLDLLGRAVTLHADWGLWIAAMVGAASVEAVVALYARQRRTVGARVGRWMLAARLLLLCVALVIFLQPVFTYEVDTRRERYVAVLWDDSASTALADPQSNASERVRLGRLYELPPAAQAPRFETVQRRWAACAQQCESLLDGLPAADAATPAPSLAEQLRRRKPALLQLADRIDRIAGEQGQAVVETIGGPIGKAADLRATLQAVQEPLAQIRREVAVVSKLLSGETDAAVAGALAPLRAQWRTIRDLARQLETRGAPLARQTDEAVVASADAGRRRELDALARLPRREIARRVLLHSDGRRPSLWDALGADRSVRLYRFAASPRSGDVETLREQPSASAAGAGDGPSPAPNAATPRAEWPQATDMAAALALVEKEIPADQLSGVLILTDGRHNRGAPAEPIARRLGQARVPVCSVVLGSEVAPRDAALTSVTCPETVFLEDRVSINAQVRAIGKRGDDLTVRLFCDGRAIQQKPVKVDSDDFRATVSLSHVAVETGIHAYRIELDASSGDAIPENNEIERFVAVTDARIKMLLVDDRPRWEFRYVRNLFTGRDKTVQMQHVLLSPDRVGGAPARPRVPASASRPYGEFEATALPESPDEWLKFEVIVLGDVGVSSLDAATLDVLERFVGKQGGSLIVVAGPRAMPHAIVGTKLADLLPATFARVDGPLTGVPEPAYRLALSPEGGAHMIMRVHPNPTENAATWNSLPPMDWRHPVLSIKPGATVLAYAEPVDPETAYAADPPGSASTSASTSTLAPARTEMERMRLLRQNPLILFHRYGAGNVLLLNFDRTWRLRYRVGDTYHHRFWSQVLRWATANKLSAGTPHVRLGTDRHRYQSGESVVVRAQLFDRGEEPVAGAKLTARVYRGDRLVLTKALDALPDSRGLYQGELGGLAESGRYRVELEGAMLPALLAVDNATKAQTEFLVTSLERTSELVDVGADWRLPTQLADITGGRAAAPCDAAGLLDLFTGGSKTVRQRQNISLWDSWPMLLLALAAAGGEWILRKKVGLT